MVIRIKDISRSADTGEQGDLVYRQIKDALANDSSVVISFAGVATATSSFVNAAFVSLLDVLSFDEIKRRIKVTDSNRQINEMIRSRMEREAANRPHLLSA
jgi:hypothetical protein